jgi:Domain of unknown function (DUF4326)
MSATPSDGKATLGKRCVAERPKAKSEKKPRAVTKKTSRAHSAKQVSAPRQTKAEVSDECAARAPVRETVKHKRTKEQPHVICVRKKGLQELGYRDLEHWLEYSNHVYVGRNMTFYVKAAVGSAFRNPFNVKKFGRRGCIDKFREHLLASPDLLAQARRELRGCVLGCWCKPEACHGDVLLQLVNQEDEDA